MDILNNPVSSIILLGVYVIIQQIQRHFDKIEEDSKRSNDYIALKAKTENDEKHWKEQRAYDESKRFALSKNCVYFASASYKE